MKITIPKKAVVNSLEGFPSGIVKLGMPIDSSKPSAMTLSVYVPNTSEYTLGQEIEIETEG